MSELAGRGHQGPQAPQGHQGHQGSGRIPSLDGLRALSISLVLVSHLALTRDAPALLSSLTVIGDAGNLGVRVFFVISGFLITSLLMDEQERTGTISMRDFYLRRTLRIFPAYYTLILVVAVAAALGRISLLPGDLLAALTYTTNFHTERAWWLGHTWSLSVEEQFYLAWPAVVLFGGRRRGVQVALAVLVIAPISRALIMGFVPAWRLGVGELFPTIADALGTGCLLAFLRERAWRSDRFRGALGAPWTLPVLLLACVLLNRLQPLLHFSLPVGESLLNLTIALVIERSMRLPGSAVGRLLNSAPLVWVGQLSYSLYLWQQPFFAHDSRAPLLRFPWNVIGLAVAAVVSFYLVEAPWLRLRRAIERRLRRASTVVQRGQA